MSFLDDKLVKELAKIKDRLKQSTHQILQSSQWNKAEVLANSGVKILKGIEELRDSVRDLKIPFLFFRVRKRLIELEENYNETAKYFDLFFDSSMRWLKAIIEKELYSDSQGLTKEHITGLVNHCQKSIDYLSSLITSKRNQYHHFQVMLITLIAVLIAVVSLVIGILK